MADAVSERTLGFHTRAVHAGARPEPVTGARAIPIFQTTSYVFEDSDSAAAYFNLQEYGNTYSRIMNPTVAAFEERIANLEGGVGAVAFASGLAAQTAALFTMLEPGDHVVASSALYGGTVTQLKHLLRKLSVDLTFVDPDRLDAWRAVLTPKTKLLFGETIGNPAGNVLDIEALARDRARPRRAADGRQHVRDAVSVPPAGMGRRHRRAFGDEVHRRPRHEHRRRRCRQGHVRLVERPLSDRRGAVAGVSRPRVSRKLRHLRLSDEAARGDAARPRRGACAAECVFVHAGSRNAAAADEGARRQRNAVARFLAADPRVERVRYAGLDDSPYAALREKYLPRGAGAVFCFDLPGGRDAGRRFIAALNLFSHLANIGDAKSLVIHPASTTHRQLSDAELAAAGIGPGTIRLSIGIEDSDDLIWDLQQGLAAASAT